MSPFAHSLLALGALLAAANAKVTNVDMGLGGCCVKFIMDIPPRPVPYQYSRQGPIKFTMMTYDTSKTLVKIPDHCALFFNKEIASQSVEVCNDYPHPSLQLYAPSMHALGDNLPSPVYASCTDNTECGPLFWKIEQVCRQPAV